METKDSNHLTNQKYKAMNYFGKHEQEQAMQSFIHDSNRDLSNINGRVNKFYEWIITNADNLKSAGIDVAELHRMKDLFKPTTLSGTIDKYLKKWETFPTPISDEDTKDAEGEGWRLTKDQMLNIFRAGAGYALNQFKEPNAKQYFKEQFNIDL